jgi:hypothetical protein
MQPLSVQKFIAQLLLENPATVTGFLSQTIRIPLIFKHWRIANHSAALLGSMNSRVFCGAPFPKHAGSWTTRWSLLDILWLSMNVRGRAQ